MSKYVWALGGTLVGAISGSVGMYFFAKKKFTESYLDLLDEEVAVEVERVKKHYSTLYKKDTLSTPQGAYDQRIPGAALQTFENGTEVLERVVKGLKYHTASAQAEPPVQNEEKPYLITYEEYAEATEVYEQKTLTYYIADDTLAGEEDEILTEDVVGTENLDKLGFLNSGEKAIYVRDYLKSVDYEIVMSAGSYAEEVLNESPDPDKGPRAGRFSEE